MTEPESIRLSGRYFLLLMQGELRRIPAALKTAMMHEPRLNPLQQLANQRVRTADIIVELVNRKPVRVVRSYFCYMQFDQQGILDVRALGKAELALFDMATRRMTESESEAIVEASSRFIARGGRWHPTTTEHDEFVEAALGKRKVPFIRGSIHR